MTDDEIIEAVRRSLVGGSDVPAPATAQQVAETERKIGYPIPPPLRRLYLEVANGGFGRRAQVIGTVAASGEGNGEDITSLFYARDPAPEHPLSGLVKVADWGCAVSSLADFTDPNGLMWGIDNGAYFRESMSLRDWIIMNLDGSLEGPLAQDHPESEDLWDL